MSRKHQLKLKQLKISLDQHQLSFLLFTMVLDCSLLGVILEQVYLSYVIIRLLINYKIRFISSVFVQFAWLGVLFLLIAAVIIVAAAIFAIKLANTGIADSILVAIIVIIIFFIASLLQVKILFLKNLFQIFFFSSQIFAIRYAFVLSKLLKNTKPLTTEQIQI